MNIKAIQLYRYGNLAAIGMIGNGTSYLDLDLARQLLDNLSELVEDLATRHPDESVFESVRLGEKPVQIKLPSIQDPAFTEAMGELRGAPKLWHVVAVSSNAGSFGHKEVLLINEDGQGVALQLQAYGGESLPERGDTMQTLRRSEVSPRQLPSVTPEQAKQIIAGLKKP